MMRAIAQNAILLTSPSAQKNQWQSMLKQWSTSKIRAQWSLIMETPFAMRHAKVDTPEHLNSLALFQPIYGHCSAKEKDHFVGLHYLEIPKILHVPIKQFSNFSLKTSICTAGSRWRKIALNLKGCLRASVGWAMENAIRLD